MWFLLDISIKLIITNISAIPHNGPPNFMVTLPHGSVHLLAIMGSLLCLCHLSIFLPIFSLFHLKSFEQNLHCYSYSDCLSLFLSLPLFIFLFFSPPPLLNSFLQFGCSNMSFKAFDHLHLLSSANQWWDHIWKLK